ncbi:MAG: GEVED domain-containing protein, partial [Pseudomonadota bacterium]
LNSAGNESLARIEFRFVVTGTTLPAILDFAASAIDVDGNGGDLREFSEFSDTLVEFAVNDPTELAVGQSGPSIPGFVRFEADTVNTAPGIDPTAVQNIVTTFFTDVSTFSYAIGSLGTDTGTRLTSLAFDCPNLQTPAPQPAAEEDFGDAPLSYGNPIHIFDAAFRLGAINTVDPGPFDSADASGDTGDDGLTLSPFAAGNPAMIEVAVVGIGGRLQAWFDWNGDGNFEGPGEQGVVDASDTDADGTIMLSLTVPPSAVPGPSFARFRWSTSVGLGIQDAAGNGEVEDYQIVILAGTPDLAAQKTTEVFDPDGLGLYAVPGNDVTYTIRVSNIGTLPTDSDSIVLIDQLPTEVTFFNGDADGAGPETQPVVFETIVPTGLDPFVFATDVGFSDAATGPASFADCTYTPGAGYDPAVRFVCFNPKGVMAAGDPDPEFAISFRTRIR